MNINRTRRILSGIVVALISVTMAFLSVKAQADAPIDPGVAEFGADAFVRILLENCPSCDIDDAEATSSDKTVLRVEFIGGAAVQREAVERIAAQWAEETSIDFQFGAFEEADIRIVFDAENAETAGTGELADSAVTVLVNTGDTSRLNVRSGPGADFDLIGKAYNGSRYDVVGRNAAGDWLQLLTPELSSQRGWVSATYVEPSGDLFDVPVVANEGVIDDGASSARTALADPSPTTLTGKLAVPVWNAGNGTYSVYVVNADGTNLRTVVENASSPALSPDGAQLAYRDWARDNRGIVIANSDGSAATRLTDFLEDLFPSWSPDAKRVIFSSYRENDRKSRIYYLWADQQNDWVLKRGEESVYGEDPYWMADGRVAYVLHNLVPEDQLLTMESDGSDPDVLWNDLTVRSPAASSDGRFVTMMSMRSGNWEIYRLNADGSGLVQLTDNPANDGLPTWSLDGKSIAFVSDRGGTWGLWVMNADGRSQRLLTPLPGSVDGIVRDELDYVTNGWLEEQISWSR